MRKGFFASYASVVQKWKQQGEEWQFSFSIYLEFPEKDQDQRGKRAAATVRRKTCMLERRFLNEDSGNSFRCSML